MYFRRKTKKYFKVFLFAFFFGIVIGGVFFLSGMFLENFDEKFIKNDQKNLKQINQHFFAIENYSFDKDYYDLDGFVEAEVKILPEIVILKNNCSVISIGTSKDKTKRLARASELKYDIRPESQDILEEIMDVFEINIKYVAIEDLREDIFYAHSIIYNDEKVLNIDSKPSDALVLALKTGAPIYVNESLFDKNGKNNC